MCAEYISTLDFLVLYLLCNAQNQGHLKIINSIVEKVAHDRSPFLIAAVATNHLYFLTVPDN